MTQHAKKLYRTIMADPDARAELVNASSDDERVLTVVRLARRHGFPVTPGDVVAYFGVCRNQRLSDDDLEGVVGGKVGQEADLYDNREERAGNDNLWGSTGA